MNCVGCTPLMSPASPSSTTGSTWTRTTRLPRALPCANNALLSLVSQRPAPYQGLYSAGVQSPNPVRHQFSPGAEAVGWILLLQGALTMSGDMLGSTTSGGAAGIWWGWRQGCCYIPHNARDRPQDKGPTIQTLIVPWLGNPDAREAPFSPFHNWGN